MLNRHALQAARSCISLVEQELGVKLRLSHENFFTMTRDYAELTGCSELVEAHNLLATFAGEEPLKVTDQVAATTQTPPSKKRIYRGQIVD